jgi:hypothetical protein
MAMKKYLHSPKSVSSAKPHRKSCKLRGKGSNPNELVLERTDLGAADESRHRLDNAERVEVKSELSLKVKPKSKTFTRALMIVETIRPT